MNWWRILIWARQNSPREISISFMDPWLARVSLIDQGGFLRSLKRRTSKFAFDNAVLERTFGPFQRHSRVFWLSFIERPEVMWSTSSPYRWVYVPMLHRGKAVLCFAMTWGALYFTLGCVSVYLCVCGSVCVCVWPWLKHAEGFLVQHQN